MSPSWCWKLNMSPHVAEGLPLRVAAPERGRPCVSGVPVSSRGPHEGEGGGQSHRWTRPPAGCDDGAGAVSQGRGASRRWKRPEMVLPKASGRPSPALPFLGLASKAQFVTAATGN